MLKDWGIAIAILLVLVIGIGFAVAYTASEQDVTFTVTDKERVETNDDSYYLVFTEDEVFSNRDSIVFTKFRSSDLQGEMEVGSTCDATVAGWRIPLFSTYRNIIEVECSQ